MPIEIGVVTLENSLDHLMDHYPPDAQTISAQFEEACADFQVPSTRAAAEHVLNSFRHLPKALSLCKYILEHTREPMVQFQAALAASSMVVRDFTLYAVEDMVHLRDFLIRYCVERAPLKKYARDQVLVTISLIVKRSLFDVAPDVRDSVLEQVKQLSNAENEHHQTLGLALASALVDQFSSSKSANIGLCWEFHHKGKMHFESHFLLDLFQQAVSRLHAAVSGRFATSFDSPSPIISEAVDLCEKILHWDFDSTNVKSGVAGTFAQPTIDFDDFDHNQNTTRASISSLPANWVPVLGNGDIIGLFFMTYSLVQNHEELAHRCSQCLVQLSGLRREYFNKDLNAEAQYASALMDGTLTLARSFTSKSMSHEELSEKGSHILATLQMIHRIVENISLAVLFGLSRLFEFLNQLGELTILSIRETVGEVEESWIDDACDESLQTWVHIVNETNPLENTNSEGALTQEQRQHFIQYLRHVSYQIVEVFVETRMEKAKQVLEEDDEEEGLVHEFKDWETYEDRLVSIGILGRLSAHQSLILLQRVLGERLERLHLYFTSKEMESDQNLILLHEQTHWIILILGYVMADAGKGERPVIPDALMQLSGSQNHEDDQVVNISKQLLEFLRFSSSFDANTVEASNFSPRVAETLAWYMERWSKSYLLFDENDYGYVSPNIAKAFGRPGPSDGQGPQILDFCINSVRTSLVLWSADPDVVMRVVLWLQSCGATPNLRSGFLKSNHFPPLIQFITERLDQLPEDSHCLLIQAITTIISGTQDSTMRNNYLGLVFDIIQSRIGAVLHRPDFAQMYHRPDVMHQVLSALEMFDGLALASEYFNTSVVYDFTSQFFESFIKLVRVYKHVNSVQLAILQFFVDLAGCLNFSVLNVTQKRQLLKIVAELIQAFGDTKQGQRRIHSEEQSEDKPYADIQAALVLFSNIIWSEDFGRDRSSHNADAADVALIGLNVVIPMMDMEMLEIPNVCQKYVQLIANLIEIFPEKLADLPEQMLNNLVASLEFGIRHTITDVSVLSMRAVACWAQWTYEQQGQQTPNPNGLAMLHSALARVLQGLCQTLFFHHLDVNMIDTASRALLWLICTERDAYTSLVNETMAQQPESTRPRLLHAFQQLDQATPPPFSPISQREVAHFKEKCVAFLMDVRAVLRVK